MSVGKQIERYITENKIEKQSLALKMGISEKKLNRIFNTSDSVLNLKTFYEIVRVLGISANRFFEEQEF